MKRINYMLKIILKKISTKYFYFKEITIQKKVLKKYKFLWKKVNLTKIQIKKIDDLWEKNYGKKISKKWHRLYMAFNGNFDEKYFPEVFFFPNLIKKLNGGGVRRKYLDDKILITHLFENISEKNFYVPKIYAYKSSGKFYNENGIITYDEVIKILENIGEVVIKPSIESSQGLNVKLLNIINGIDIITNCNIIDILKKYEDNYMIQEKIVQHNLLDKLNKTSINTFRIWSYTCDGKIYVPGIVLRIGRNTSKLVDNFSAGGIAIGINEDGTLMKYAYSSNGSKYSKHPDTNITFEGYKIPHIKEIIDFVKKNHYRIPHIGFIGWDLTLDKNENIVFIEANITWPGIRLLQEVIGKPIFGENTEKMIQMLKK